MGHPFSAVRRPIVAVLGQFKGHAKQTWCTSLELNWPFLRRVEADDAKCPEIYILGHWLAHCETKASLQFYLLGYIYNKAVMNHMHIYIWSDRSMTWLVKKYISALLMHA